LTEPRELTSSERLDELRAGAFAMPAPDGPLSELTPDGGDVQNISSGWRLAVREFMSNRLAVAALALLVFFLLFCFIGPLLYKTNQTSTDIINSNLSPGGGFPLGTDENGFDELGRIMKGGQAAFEIGLFASFVAIVIGTLYGAISGLVGGIVDGVLMRFVDILLSIPFLLIVLVLATKYNGNVVQISLILGIFSWLIPARLVRGEVLTLRTRDFVLAAQTMGSGRWRLIFRHLIPNAMSVTIVNVTFLVADSILALAYLGALGFGLPFPDTSWGDMLGNAQQYVQNGQWWLVYPVGGCLVLVVLAFNLVGDALRDAVDVRLRRR
jgi:ABC-type dipeptide/oligopeptide/nickel transport system permease subunit